MTIVQQFSENKSFRLKEAIELNEIIKKEFSFTTNRLTRTTDMNSFTRGSKP